MRSRACVPASETASCRRCGQTGSGWNSDEGRAGLCDPLLRRSKMLTIPQPKRYDAIVIGGGPAGSTTALMLARAGWAVALIEKSRFPRPKVCGEFISASTFPLLAEFGLLEDVRGLAGHEVRRVAVFAGETVSTSPMPASQGRSASGGGRSAASISTSSCWKPRSAPAPISGNPFASPSVERSNQGWRCDISHGDKQRVSVRQDQSSRPTVRGRKVPGSPIAGRPTKRPISSPSRHISTAPTLRSI